MPISFISLLLRLIRSRVVFCFVLKEMAHQKLSGSRVSFSYSRLLVVMGTHWFSFVMFVLAVEVERFFVFTPLVV